MAFTTINTGLLDPFSTTFIGIGRNRMINGDMRIDQANNGAAITVNASGVFRSVDQMIAQGEDADGVFTLQRSTSTPPTNFTHFLRATCTTADASVGAGQIARLFIRLEGNNVKDFLWGTANTRTVTISFWVRSSLTGTYTGSIRNAGPNTSYSFEYSISSANTWEFKTITVVGDTNGPMNTDASTGTEITWSLALGSTLQGTPNTWVAGAFFGTSNQVNWLSSNSSRTYDITGIQVEIGSAATNFEYRYIQTEYMFCLRYFYKILGPAPVALGEAVSTSQVISPIRFAVPMRTTPTLTTIGVANITGSDSAGGAHAFTAVALGGFQTADSVQLSGTGASGFVAGNASNMAIQNSSGALEFDARL